MQHVSAVVAANLSNSNNKGTGAEVFNPRRILWLQKVTAAAAIYKNSSEA